jgi:hypothetical protein
MEEWISLEYIETLLCQLFSHRAGPLKQAFEAHRGENYYVSIPVFLAQADGISHELFGKSVYSRYHRDEKPRKGKSGAGNPIYRDIIDGKQLGDYWMAYLESYRNPSPLNARSGERDTNPLNRHAILHGESTTYGTYINSLKAISFLLSVGTVLSEIKVEVSSVCAEALRRTFGK